MIRTVVLNVVGLTESLLGDQTPRITAFRKRGAIVNIDPAFPALTTTAQSNYLTATPPAQHGIVANGWYDREMSEVQFWKQSNKLVHGRKIWDELRARDHKFTCAKLFWWYNMYSTADWSITPRPMYPADGRKVFDIYSWPYDIRDSIKHDLGEFPFPGFWGPSAGVQTPAGAPDCASRWIAESAKWIEKRFRPTLNLVYLPHLDYSFQRLGPKHPDAARDIAMIDELVGELILFFQKRDVQIILLSEYGITPVDKAIHLNRIFRERGWLTVKEELGRELLDAGASRVFAVADHQVAHIYVNDTAMLNQVRSVVEFTPGVSAVLAEKEKIAAGINHSRAGDLIAVAKENAWFTYYYWLDDKRAPDFARCVDIHRKPGYDPVELFIDPKIRSPKLKVAGKLLRKKLGFRMLMDVIPLDASLVKGSHGCRPASTTDWPMLITQRHELLAAHQLPSTEVYNIIKNHVISG